jgi:formylglycine-generating enzyme required for sulfatase activity
MMAVDKARFGLCAAAGVALLVLLGGCRGRDVPAPSEPARADAPEVIVTKTGIEMVRLPGGEFLMGDDQGEEDEKPAHRVHVSPFFIDVCEVTQASYQSLMGKNPAKFTSPDRPVERASWFSAIQYCNLRSVKEGLKPCYDLKTLACDFTANGYRLPTEAEWEYACRAGTTTRWSFGNDPAALGTHAWFKKNAKKSTQPVRQQSPNPWGLYDMHGNVAEWCNDFYKESYDQAGQGKDPRGPASGDERVLRGGSWSTGEENCRSSARASAAPGFADVCFGYEAYGFRCVRADTSRP